MAQPSATSQLEAARAAARPGKRYVTVQVKFVLTLAIASAWAVLSFWIAQRWITELAGLIGAPLAIMIIMGIAILPGFMNAFLVAGLLLDRRPRRKPITIYPDVTILVAAYNEEDSILSTLKSIELQHYPAQLDVIVINDMNLFDGGFMAQDANNRRFAANLVNFATTGTRNSGRVVMYDRGRNSSCFLDTECSDGPQGNATIDSVLNANGFSLVKVDTVASWAIIPPNVKVIFLWNPTIPYTLSDINGFKLFASQGGRIVFLGEHVGFYGQVGIDTENQFLADMGSQFTNVGAIISCVETIPLSQIRAHQTTTGLTDIIIACASEALPGPNDFPLIFESTGKAVAGVAKISTVPLPLPPAGAEPAAARLSAPPAVDGANRRH